MKQLAITFDDGPDPRYTGLLLDLLKEHQIPATFFVVATNAKNNPDLIHRMLAEHHQVAMHSYSHRHAWLSSYPYMKKDFQYSFEIMKELGCRPCCYRPPWGARNPFTGYFLKQYGLRLVLWDVMVQDWQAKATVQRTKDRILARVFDGAVLCLHDAGEKTGGSKGAPLRTIEALRMALPFLEREYVFKTIEELKPNE